MRRVGMQRSGIPELHHAAVCENIRARRNILVVAGFHQSRNLPLQGANLFGRALLLLLRDSWLPLKQESVNVHKRVSSPFSNFRPDKVLHLGSRSANASAGTKIGNACLIW